MLLYIVRHAFAGQRGDPAFPDDALRPLTKKGRKQFGRLIKKLSRRGFAPALVVSSPLLRCRQTADELALRIAPSPAMIVSDDLQPGSRLAPLVALANEQPVNSLAWVGHSPDVEQLASELLGARADGLRFAKGAVAAIGFEGPMVVGQGMLRWLVTPKLYR